MRKVVFALSVTTSLALFATPASAQTFPPGAGRGLAVSESTVAPGKGIVVAGVGAASGAAVTITLTRVSSSSLGAGSQVLAAGPVLARLAEAADSRVGGAVPGATAAADGSFRTTVTIPAGTRPGVYTLTASSRGEVLSVATIRVVAVIAGGLPFTGTDLVPGLALGAGLIVAGGLLLLAVRRRHRSTA
jgi:LPXTG cell wall anchor motif